MKDRVVQYPARYQLVPVAGTTDTFDLVAVPGTVTEAGTELNKAALLKDATAAAIESALGVTLPNDPMVDDVFDALAITPTKIIAGSYVGTGAFGSSSPNSYTFAEAPIFVLIRSAEAGYAGWYQTLPIYIGETRGFTRQSAATVSQLTVSWSNADKTISFYGDTAASQLSVNGYLYAVIAVFGG